MAEEKVEWQCGVNDSKKVEWDGGVSGKTVDEGVVLSYRNLTIRFRSSIEIDPVKLCDEIGAEASEILKVKFKLFEEEVKQPLSCDRLKRILGVTVKRDDVNKVIVFLAMLSAYTQESQFNVSFRAPSSTGKSYIPLELAYYFPQEDVLVLAYSSPTSFFHDNGEWDEDARSYIMNLENKIVIFLDQPHDLLLQRLRPLLSHDKRELIVKITDKSEKRGLRTKTVVIKGFPSVIFCSGSLKMDEQEQTRSILLSPEVAEEKIREAIFLKAMRKGNPLAYAAFLEEHPERKILRERVKKIKEEKIRYILIPQFERVVEKFLASRKVLKPRHQRDIERIISLIQAFALLNLWHRKRTEENDIYANEEDVEEAFKLYSEIEESQELGIPPYVYMIYRDVIKPLIAERSKKSPDPVGVTRKDIMRKHFEVFGRIIPEYLLKQEVIPALESSGLIYQEPDPDDRRRVLIFCTDQHPLYNTSDYRDRVLDALAKVEKVDD